MQEHNSFPEDSGSQTGWRLPKVGRDPKVGPGGDFVGREQQLQ